MMGWTITPDIGSWGEEKYRHVALYSSLFVKSMRNKWDCLVYIDLFPGAGRARIRSTARIVQFLAYGCLRTG